MQTEIETRVIDGLELRRKVFYMRAQVVSVIYTLPARRAACRRIPTYGNQGCGSLPPGVQKKSAPQRLPVPITQ